MNYKKYLKFFVKLAFSFGFFYVLFSFIEANELADLLGQVNGFYLLVSFVITWVMVGASCWKWKVILDLKGEKQSYISLFKVYCIGYFFSNLLPSTIGGDVVRSYYVGERISNHAHSAVAIFIERFSGVLLLFFLAIFMPMLHFELYKSPYVYVPAACSFFFLILLFWIGKTRDTVRLFTTFYQKFLQMVKMVVCRFQWGVKLFALIERAGLFIEAKLNKVKNELKDAVKTIKSDRRCFINIFLLTVLFYVLTWFNVYFSYKAFNISVSFLMICALTPTIMFAAHLPVTMLGNIGYFESIFVFYFLLAGVPAEQSLVMSLLIRGKVLIVGIVGFFIYNVYKKDKQLADEFATAIKKSSPTKS